MKLRFWIFLITLLLPTSAFANSCKSFLKNKTYKPDKAVEAVQTLKPVMTLSMAMGTHKPTKETIWKTCYQPYAFNDKKRTEDFFFSKGQQFICDGIRFELVGYDYFDTRKKWISMPFAKYPILMRDKQGIYWPLSFKGKWNKRFCNKLDLDNLSSLEKVLRQRRGDTNVNEYTDTRIIFGKYYRKDAGGKILFRREIFSTYKTFEPIF